MIMKILIVIYSPKTIHLCNNYNVLFSDSLHVRSVNIFKNRYKYLKVGLLLEQYIQLWTLDKTVSAAI